MTEKQTIIKMNPLIDIVIYGYSAVLIFLSFLFAELDFVLGVLIGCVIVILNFFLIRRVFGKVFSGNMPKSKWIIAYFFKLAITFATIYLSYRYLHVDAYGLIIGLSTIVISIFVYSLITIIK